MASPRERSVADSAGRRPGWALDSSGTNACGPPAAASTARGLSSTACAADTQAAMCALSLTTQNGCSGGFSASGLSSLRACVCVWALLVLK